MPLIPSTSHSLLPPIPRPMSTSLPLIPYVYLLMQPTNPSMTIIPSSLKPINSSPHGTSSRVTAVLFLTHSHPQTPRPPRLSPPPCAYSSRHLVTTAQTPWPSLVVSSRLHLICK